MFTPTLPPADLDHVLAHTGALWDDLRGQRLFITGGTGFFGMWLIESFLWANEKLELGAEAVVLSRDPAAFLRKMRHLAGQPCLAFCSGTMDRFEFPVGRFSAVIHAATEFGAPPGFDQAAAFDRDILGTRRVLDFARRCRARRFLFTSSGAVYGRQPPKLTRIDEDCDGSPNTMDPNSGYAQAKRVSEFLCSLHAKAHGLETKIARCFAFVGPYLPLDADLAVGNFIRDALASETIHINGDGTSVRSYLYAADLTIWLWSILCRGATCRPYNVGSEEAVTIAELAGKIAKVISPANKVIISGRPVSGKAASWYVPSTRRAGEELGLEATSSLRLAIEKTAAWHRSRSGNSLLAWAGRAAEHG